MVRLIVRSKEVKGNIIYLSENNQHHLLHVLRVKPGDHIEVVIEGKEVLKCHIQKVFYDHLLVETEEQAPAAPLRPFRITLAQCLPKQDKMSEIIRKCTELGIDEVIPVISSRSVSVPQPDQFQKKSDRWAEIARSASQQSRQVRIPVIQPVVPFADFIRRTDFSSYDLKVVPWEEEQNSTFRSVLNAQDSLTHLLLFIGSEGGISTEEIRQLESAGFRKATLGPTVLRVENAAFFALANVLYQFG